MTRRAILAAACSIAVVATALVGVPAGTAAAWASGTAPGGAPFFVRGSVEQVAVTGARQGADARLADSSGKQVGRGTVDAQGNRAALAAIGSGLRRAKQPDEAIRALNLALEASPGQPTVALSSELALAQNAAGDLPAAKQSLMKAIGLDDRDPTPHYLLGTMFAISGDLKSAKKHWERCVGLDPDGPLANKARERLASLKPSKR